MAENKESTLQYLLRLGIKVSIAIELLVLLGITIQLTKEGFPQPSASDLQNAGILGDFYLLLGPYYFVIAIAVAIYAIGGGIVATQLYLYRIIGSSWDNMSLIKKVFLTLIVGIPAIYFGAIIVYIIVILVIILVVLWVYAAGQPSYNRTRRDAEITGLRNDIRNLKDEIKKL